MAKEVELKVIKKIELKVYVHCCDGCKRKIKKVLHSIEGVFKIEIDPSLPKVAVLGNMDPQILIKKLLKAGKQAEIWSNGNQNVINVKRDAETAGLCEKEKAKSTCEQTKYTDISITDTEKCKKITIGDDAGNRASEKDQKLNQGGTNSSILKIASSSNALQPQQDITCTMYPSISYDTGSQKIYAQNSLVAEHYTINLPYYTLPSFIASPHPSCYGHEHYHCGMIVPQLPPVQTSAVPRVMDYFNEENTTGCYVM